MPPVPIETLPAIVLSHFLEFHFLELGSHPARDTLIQDDLNSALGGN
jgi:hypothetical protein